MKILAPERGAKHQLVLLAEENAAAAASDHLRDQAIDQQAVEELKRLLRLERPPRRIEGFDISNTMGDQSVASMVVWEDGQAKKSDYRAFRIKTVEGANDFASMQEVVMRRYSPHEQTEGLPLPDLILIDGGIGQLGAAMEGIKNLGLTGLRLIGLAKARGEKEERIFVPGRKGAIVLAPSSPATHLLQRIRDEAHRFAITYHRKLRGKALVTSRLEEIPGIGEVKKKRLLKQFISLDEIARATDEQMQKAAGVDAKTAAAIRKALGRV